MHAYFGGGAGVIRAAHARNTTKAGQVTAEGPRFVLICAWCDPATQPPPPPGTVLTHGICSACAIRARADRTWAGHGR
jgi:hypothetical protein